MAHSVELLFDARTEDTLRGMWTALADAGLPSQADIRSGTNRPHVTLSVAERIDGAVDPALVALADLLPLPCLIGSPVLFGGRRVTLARLIVPSAGLLAFQNETHRRCLPFLRPGPLPHAEPGQWTPHTTLGRRIDPADLGRALAAAPGGDISASLCGLRRWDSDTRVSHVLIGR